MRLGISGVFAMRRAMKRLGLALSLGALIGIGGSLGGHTSMALAASAPNATCSGTLPAGTYNNVTVPANTTCQLNSTTIILGNVVAVAGSFLFADSTSIGGNIQANQSYGIELLGSSTVGGNIQATNLGFTAIIGATVRGGVVIDGDTYFTEIYISGIGKNLQLYNNAGGTQVFNTQIGNNLDCENNQPPPTFGGNTAKHFQGQCTS
jgi:hypothetical protein